MFFQIGKIYVNDDVSDLDLAVKHYPRAHHQQDSSKLQEGGHHLFIKVSHNHCTKRANEGNGSKGLYDKD